MLRSVFEGSQHFGSRFSAPDFLETPVSQRLHVAVWYIQWP